MNKFNNHVYWLLTLKKEEMMQHFFPALGIALVYFMYTALRSIIFKNLKTEAMFGSLLVFVILGTTIFIFYSNLLTQEVSRQETPVEKREPDRNIREEKTIEAMEVHEEEVEQYMFFNDAVTALWESNSSSELVTTLATRAQHQISDIERTIK